MLIPSPIAHLVQGIVLEMQNQQDEAPALWGRATMEEDEYLESCMVGYLLEREVEARKQSWEWETGQTSRERHIIEAKLGRMSRYLVYRKGSQCSQKKRLHPKSGTLRVL